VNKVDKIIKSVRLDGRRVLTEYESKLVLAEYGIPVVLEELAFDLDSIKEAASRIGYPVALQLCSAQLRHKTEKGLIRLGLRDGGELVGAFAELERQKENSGAVFLIQEMVRGARELVIGMTRGLQFGPVAMFGLGGIFTRGSF
jgi:acyl-CoA synthetase (NDP forming)